MDWRNCKTIFEWEAGDQGWKNFSGRHRKPWRRVLGFCEAKQTWRSSYYPMKTILRKTSVPASSAIFYGLSKETEKRFLLMGFWPLATLRAQVVRLQENRGWSTL